MLLGQDIPIILFLFVFATHSLSIFSQGAKSTTSFFSSRGIATITHPSNTFGEKGDHTKVLFRRNPSGNAPKTQKWADLREARDGAINAAMENGAQAVQADLVRGVAAHPSASMLHLNTILQTFNLPSDLKNDKTFQNLNIDKKIEFLGKQLRSNLITIAAQRDKSSNYRTIEGQAIRNRYLLMQARVITDANIELREKRSWLEKLVSPNDDNEGYEIVPPKTSHVRDLTNLRFHVFKEVPGEIL